MNIKGAIFDMDGTLVDSLGFWDTYWPILGEKYFGDPAFRASVEDEKAMRTMVMRDAMGLVHEKYGVADTLDELMEFANTEIVRFYKETVKVKDGVVEYLESLCDRGVKMCVASATEPQLVQIALETCGLARFFPRVISCSDVGSGKDRPDVFLVALDYLGTDLANTWVFEDSLLALETATKAGFKTVGIFDRHTDGQDRIQAVSTLYIPEGSTLLMLNK